MAISSIASASSLAPAGGGAARSIVLLLHGYGSNGADLISLAPHWQQVLPDTLFLAPDAPEHCPGAPGGYQWWDLSTLSVEALAAGAARVAPALNAYIDEQLERHGLAEDRLVIVGFSQGTMMALHVGPRRERQVAGIVGYSGMLTDALSLSHELRTKPPVLLIHGTADPVVPIAAMHKAKSELQRLGLDVTAHASPGLEHSIDPTGLRLGGDFIRRVLGTG